MAAITLAQGYTEIPWPNVATGDLRFAAGGSAGVTVSGLTIEVGTPTSGAFMQLTGTFTTTGSPILYYPIPTLPAAVQGRAIYVHDMAFSAAKTAGTGTGVVAGTDTWLTAIGLYEAVETAASATIAITSALYEDTTDRLSSTASATPTDIVITGMNAARTVGTKVYLGLTLNANDEATTWKFYIPDHGYIRYSDRPYFLAT